MDQLHNAAQQVADKIDEIIIAVGTLAAGTPHTAAQFAYACRLDPSMRSSA